MPSADTSGIQPDPQNCHTIVEITTFFACKDERHGDFAIREHADPYQC